jgi:hypothetical protein
MADLKVTYSNKAMGDADYAVDQACDSWQKAQKAIQVACVSITVAQYQHTDTETTKNRVTRLIEGAKGTNTPAIEEWFVLQGYKFSKDGVTGVPSKEVIEEKAGSGFSKAKGLMWWTLKAIKPYAGFDQDDAFNNFMKSVFAAKKLADKDEEKAALISVDMEAIARAKAAYYATEV